MEKYVLDIYLDEVNRDYLNKLTFLSLSKSRSLGFACSADLFCEAYSSYDSEMLEETIRALETCHVCRYIVDKYEIAYKEDLVYLIRHPSKLDVKMDPNPKTVRKKVLYFFDIETPGNEYKLDAYNYLNDLRPVKRASLVDKILEQYLITTKNKYFIEQAAARLLNDLVKVSEFDMDGNVVGSGKDIIDAIWAIGYITEEK